MMYTLGYSIMKSENSTACKQHDTGIGNIRLLCAPVYVAIHMQIL